MRRNLIATHEDFQRVPYRQFIAWYWQDRQPDTVMPDPAQTRGAVAAEINHGRWLVECPDGCGNAVFASPVEPWYLCTICGPALNGGKPFAVVFPADRVEIETELLKRAIERRNPVSMPWENSTRNWKPGETLDQLRAENVARGVR